MARSPSPLARSVFPTLHEQLLTWDERNILIVSTNDINPVKDAFCSGVSAVD